MVEALEANDIQPLIALHQEDGPVADYLQQRRLAYVSAPGPALAKRGKQADTLRAFARSLRHARAQARFLTDHAVDIVHTNDGRSHVQWALPAKWAGARHLWHHRGDPDAVGANLLAPVFADHMITVSRFARPQGPVFQLGHKLSIVHSPFDHPKALGDRAAARAMLIDALKVPPETRFLGFFGLLIDRKRPIAFVEAVAAFVTRYPELPVMGLLFGVPGSEAPDYDQRVVARARALGVEGHVRLMGFREPVEPWMQAVDVLLVPAVREPFGRTLIEAMFLETPVVATDHGGNPEAIENGVTGNLVPADRPWEFALPVHRLLTDDSYRQQITATARSHVLATHSTAAHVAAVCKIYRTLLSERQHGDLHRVRWNVP
ncbi:glycosyltransferase involved in cell wall biosynthesis [Rhodoligotrophos appendicifer]|uniref:glycosyltransferase family 4 protein n=1 Tax=Rhodoligotrophos appendicifer TaxID=987056 RepID=UPI0014784626|nr:glycosyltransferase family 4 protein [Rhodoligotrophos appendicifer]